MKHLITLLLFVSAAATTVANNVVISNITSHANGSYTQIAFDLSWENSWRTSILTANHDAVWVFIKYKDVDGLWKHLHLTNANNAIAAGYAVSVPADLKGAFIYRSATGSGNVSLTDVRLGVTVYDGVFDVQVFGVEMVYIPPGNFFVGDGNGTTESANAFHAAAGNTSVQVSTALLSDVRTDANIYDDAQIETIGIGIDGDGGLDTDDNGTIDNALFPTGLAGFYCMKYEISQRGYADFLNTLTYTQQTFNTTTAPSSAVGTNALSASFRTFIEIVTPGVSTTAPAVYGLDGDADNVFDESTDGEWIALNNATWPMLCAYLDWAALRPMTELEFEKICRGPTATLLNEYAWGTTTLFATTYTLAASAQSTEIASNASGTVGNAAYTTTSSSAMLRSGIFATGSSNRATAGAAYYGVMEMSGNAYERPVTIGNVAGRSFTGVLGNGELNTSGHANVDFWPGINGNNTGSVANAIYGGTTGVTQAAGSGWRGGEVGYGATTLRTSDRQFGAEVNATFRTGGRGVR